MLGVWGQHDRAHVSHRRGAKDCQRLRADYAAAMMNERSGAVLDGLLEPVSRCFNLDVARALVALHVAERDQARVEELADKCNEGQLTPEEQSEYEAYVSASTLIGILQAKARRTLTQAQAG